MPKYSYRLTLALAVVGSFAHLASCSSKYRADGKRATSTSGLPGLGGTASTTSPSGGGNGGTAGSGTGGTQSSNGGVGGTAGLGGEAGNPNAGAAGETGGSGGGGTSGGGSGGVGSGGVGTGGIDTTDAGGSATDAGGSATDAGGSATDAGGSATDAGGSATDAGGNTTDAGGTGGGGTGGGGTGGTGGAPPRDEHCDPEAPDCDCDATACFLVQGASCTQATDCKTQICGVTQDAANVCCAESCGSTEVCSDDGTQCVAADVCEDTVERCNESGNHQVCEDGQWSLVQNCGGRGCSIELTGGCLSKLGDDCADDEECGLGTCQETPDGSLSCCDASCGTCLVCNAAGNGCTDPDVVKAGCQCTQATASVCNDTTSCTDDACVDGKCENDLQGGYCLIDGACIDHNQAEPGNPCRYCDTGVRDRAWTNSSNSVSCDDDLWCTGNDTCNGSGQCQHQFPTSNRCTESGMCALTTCDETRDSCYEPDTVSCSTTTEPRCLSTTTCGQDVESRTVTRFCSGASAACTGEIKNGNWGSDPACNGNQTCTNGFTCQDTVGCGNTWCDSSTGLCWTLDEPSIRPLVEATDYCNTLSRGGRGPGSWRLPTITEWLRLSKGCDQDTGTAQGASFQSNCTWDPANPILTPCYSGCPVGEGPGNGCYWPAAMGSCDPQGYWSSTLGPGTYYINTDSNWVVTLSDFRDQAVRCVTEE